MQIAEILSDLTSLRVCGHEEALALVRSHRSLQTSETTRATSDSGSESTDLNLQRAKDLVALHYDVKMKYVEKGLDENLRQAREDVARVSRN